MSLHEEKCWLIVCDTCGEPMETGDGGTLHLPLGDVSFVADHIRDMDWRELEGKHTCESCLSEERAR